MDVVDEDDTIVDVELVENVVETVVELDSSLSVEEGGEEEDCV